MHLILAFMILSPHWVKVKDGYKIHMRYVISEHDGTKLVLGEYYEETSDTFIAQCYPGEPLSLNTETAARNAVLECRVWE